MQGLAGKRPLRPCFFAIRLVAAKPVKPCDGGISGALNLLSEMKQSAPTDRPGAGGRSGFSGRGGNPLHIGHRESLREQVAAAENGRVHGLPRRRKAGGLLAHGLQHQRRAIQRAIAFSRQAKRLARAGGGVAGGGSALRGGEKVLFGALKNGGVANITLKNGELAFKFEALK